MAVDARISTALPGHPKTKRIIKRLGAGAAWYLVRLFLWAAENKSDGDLTGMTNEDIEIALDWPGENGALINELFAVRFLDGSEGAFKIHDWAEHNPWANGAEMRSVKARWNAVKRHHGVKEADKQVPEYAAIRTSIDADSNAISNADSNKNGTSGDAVAMLQTKRSNAPSPSPSPSPSPDQELSANASQAESDLAGPKPDPLQSIVEIYHRVLPRCERISVLNPKRRKRLLSAIKLAKTVCRSQGWTYEPEGFWVGYFGECHRDPWMRGDVPNPKNLNWKQNLDVLLAEDRFAGVMDRAISAMRGDA